MAYEYMNLQRMANEQYTAQDLNRVAKEGWELAFVVPVHAPETGFCFAFTYIFRRPRPET